MAAAGAPTLVGKTQMPTEVGTHAPVVCFCCENAFQSLFSGFSPLKAAGDVQGEAKFTFSYIFYIII
jgi:hypothetical protein